MTGPSYIEFGSVSCLIEIVFHRFKVRIRCILLILGGRLRRHVLHLEPAVPRIANALAPSLIMFHKDVPYPVRVLDFLTRYSWEGAHLSLCKLSFLKRLHFALLLLLFLELLEVLRRLLFDLLEDLGADVRAPGLMP